MIAEKQKMVWLLPTTIALIACLALSTLTAQQPPSNDSPPTTENRERQNTTPSPANPLIITADNFIQFLKSPPPTDTLIFQRTLTFYPKAFLSMKAAREFLDAVQSGEQEVEKQPGEIFAVRHLPNRQFIIQQLHHPKDVWNGSVRLHYFAGRDASGWWWLETGRKRGTDSPDGVFSINGAEMPILPTYYKLSTELFRLGMYDLDPDTVLIDEFRKKHFAKKGEIPFQAMRRKDFGGGKLSGTAFAVNNRIERISYQHEPKGGGTISGREIGLRYLNNQLSFVRVFNRVKHRNETKMMHYADYKVLQYTPAKDPHPKGYCNAEQFMADSDFNILHSKDGEMYNIKRDPNNPIEPSPSPLCLLWKTMACSRNDDLSLRRLLVSSRPKQEKPQQ